MEGKTLSRHVLRSTTRDVGLHLVWLAVVRGEGKGGVDTPRSLRRLPSFTWGGGVGELRGGLACEEGAAIASQKGLTAFSAASADAWGLGGPCGANLGKDEGICVQVTMESVNRIEKRKSRASHWLSACFCGHFLSPVFREHFL